MFAADTDFEVGIGGTAFLNTHAYELAYTCLVKYFEGVGLDDSVFLVEFEEFGSVVAGIAESHLSEVVGTEREEIGHLSDFVCGESSTGHFNHCADFVLNRIAFFLEYLGCGGVDYISLILELLECAYKGNHDFGMNIDAFRLAVE